MIETPTIVETPARAVAVLAVTVPRDRIREVMGPGIQELMGAVAAQGIATAGPWFTHHLRMDPEVFDFEIGVPVASAIAPAGRVRPSERPAMRVARATYRGPYEGLPSAWEEFDAWVRAEGHGAGGDVWETYAVGPESGSEPSEWVTILERPLAAARS
jgi:effector-binding domain-containing protein